MSEIENIDEVEIESLLSDATLTLSKSISSPSSEATQSQPSSNFVEGVTEILDDDDIIVGDEDDDASKAFNKINSIMNDVKKKREEEEEEVDEEKNKVAMMTPEEKRKYLREKIRKEIRKETQKRDSNYIRQKVDMMNLKEEARPRTKEERRKFIQEDKKQFKNIDILETLKRCNINSKVYQRALIEKIQKGELKTQQQIVNDIDEYMTLKAKKVARKNKEEKN